MLENFLPFYLVSCFTRKKFVNFNKFIVKCEWKRCYMKEIKYMIFRFRFHESKSYGSYGSGSTPLESAYRMYCTVKTAWRVLFDPQTSGREGQEKTECQLLHLADLLLIQVGELITIHLPDLCRTGCCRQSTFILDLLQVYWSRETVPYKSFNFSLEWLHYYY